MRYVSLFSGIEAATHAWHPLGWHCVAVAEIEPFPSRALAHHYPNTTNLGDVTLVTEDDIKRLGPVDLLVFGSPCQDLSVAGKRKGLDGERSGLFFTAMRIAGWMREHCGLRWALWENVPGAFSSNEGRDFAAVVDHMAGVAGTEVPPKGWGVEGVAIGSQALVEWSTLDAQWFGVAQRRRRVFALADFGNWAGRPPVLLEPHSVRGDSAPSRAAGKDITNCLTASTGGSCVEDARGNRLVPVDTLCVATGQAGAGAEVCRDHSPTLNCNHEVPYVVAVTGDIAHTLNSCNNGKGCSEDGTGRGVPTVALCLPFDTTQITSAANRSSPKPGDPYHPLAAGAHAPAVAWSTKLHNTASNGAGKFYENYTASLDASSPPPAVVAFDCKASGMAGFGVGEVSSTMRAMGAAGSHANGGGHLAVASGWMVRRLTPRECERLQGFRDDFTAVPDAKGKPAADGPRYKALGNSMAVPVMQWIGKSIEFAHLYF